MDHVQELSENGPETEVSGADHYAALTDYMVKYNGTDLLACHYGLWGLDTTTEREAMLCATYPGTGVRPWPGSTGSGCGLRRGRYGDRAGGNVRRACHRIDHLRAPYRGGGEVRETAGGHLVEFRHGDFMDLPFPDASFDAVGNHESFCYAPDKLAYLQGVYRVLKPGGRWQALDGYLSGAPMSETQKAIAASVERNFHIPPLVSWRDLVATLEESGFEGIREQDFTSQVMPSTEKARKQWLLFVFMTPPSLRRPYHGFQWATVAFDEGLKEGVLTYRFVSGVKPD